ncbi:spore germination protein GerPE [Cohnella soli]|uniref:Spore germination protein GerPE n=1 Tax=Cohnella soli TaxID=425005 RepID=A0ABW0HRW4_9BACL
MSIEPRTSKIGCVFVNTVSTSGIVQFGDGGTSTLRSKAIAVQRKIANFLDDEFKFETYPIFYKPRLRLVQCDQVSFVSRSTDCPDIRVGWMYMLGVSASSLFRAGYSGPIDAEARIKHIRHFNDLTPDISSEHSPDATLVPNPGQSLKNEQ